MSYLTADPSYNIENFLGREEAACKKRILMDEGGRISGGENMAWQENVLLMQADTVREFCFSNGVAASHKMAKRFRQNEV